MTAALMFFVGFWLGLLVALVWRDVARLIEMGREQ